MAIEKNGISDGTCCLGKILNDPFVNVLGFFVFIFPCRLGRTECSILILAVLAILLKESIFYWEVQINKFPSSQRMACVLVP